MLGALGPSFVNTPNFDEKSPSTNIPITPQGLNVVAQKCIPIGVTLVGAHFAQLHNGVLSSGGRNGPSKEKVRHHAMDLVKKGWGLN
jgi:hypothetical protein